MKKQITLILFVLCLTVLFTDAQYKKKVVSYVNNVLAPASFGLSQAQIDLISRAVSQKIQMERFNYASLPENIVSEFADEASRMNFFTAENVRPLIEKTLAPKFVEVLDINKELLSKQNLTEADRNTFLATKAQAAGLSAAQLESILNSGFFYVPYVAHYRHSVEKGERDEKNEKGKVIRKVPTVTFTHSIKVGLLWFQLKVDKLNNPSVVFIGEANGWKGSSIQRSDTKDEESGKNIDWDTFEDAVMTSAVNIENETKKIEQFQLSGTVSETTYFGVKLNLGSREGLGLDDTYWIEELEETESGEVIKNRRGFVKIREVGNNKTDESATSYAQTITGTNYSPGLSVSEIPMIGINAVFGLGSIPVSIKPYDNRTLKFGLSKYDFAINLTNEIKNSIGPFVWLQGDLAKSTKISELWFHAGATLGFLNVDGKFYLPTKGVEAVIDSSFDIGASLTGYANVGLVKKFYLRRFGIVFQADLKYWLTSFTATGKDSKGDDLNYSLINDSFGFDGRAGLEVYLSPTLSLGAGGEYNLFPENNVWSASVTDKDKNETKKTDAVGPSTKYSGLAFYFWVNYALPSLF